jgi:RNA polymerase sigma factor (sigma-70 family)
MTSDLDLLGQYARNKAQDAFTEIVRRHVDLVYSAALRQVRSPQLAEEVAQSVFTDLARNAVPLCGMKPDTVLTAWLYQVTRRTAVDVVRKESRRQLREQIASELNAMNATAPDWTRVEPFLDEAMHTLDDTDRAAFLLRYFENKSFREVGQTLGTSDDTAQKRVSRAVEHLREFLSKRGVAVGASGLVVGISANAIQAAPAGLAVTISTAAVLAGTTMAATATATITKTIAMTTLQKTLVTATLAIVAGAGIYEGRQASTLRSQVQTLQQAQAPLAEQNRQLQRERDDVTSRLAALTTELAGGKQNPSEVLKLRGEVGVLLQEKAANAGESAVSKANTDPETRKALHDQDKLTMGGWYFELAKRLNLTPEQTEQFNDLLADHLMDNLDLITQVLHDGKSLAEMRQIFSAADTAFQGKVQALLGDDGLTQYQDYTKNIGSPRFVYSFADSLTGDSATIEDKKNRLIQAMEQATQSAVAAAGLPADFQTFPMLNPVNIASEEEAAQSLQLLDSVFGQTAASASTFLSADELNKFQDFRTNVIKRTQAQILVNRKMMAPVSK